MRKLIEVRDLVFAWPHAPQAVLRIPQLNVVAGETVFIHGPSGCGKSTLLSLLCGVLVASGGQVKLMGHDWAKLRPSRRDVWRADHLGYVFQQFNLLPYLSALDNVVLPCQFSRTRREGTQPMGGPVMAAQDLLTQMSLPPALWSQPATSLSVGQQQRVAAARALIGSPDVLIADEPTSALDETTREAFMNTLLAASQRTGCAVVFVSHDLRLAPHFDRCLAWGDIHQAAPHEVPA